MSICCPNCVHYNVKFSIHIQLSINGILFGISYKVETDKGNNLHFPQTDCRMHTTGNKPRLNWAQNHIRLKSLLKTECCLLFRRVYNFRPVQRNVSINHRVQFNCFCRSSAKASSKLYSVECMQMHFSSLNHKPQKSR